MNTNLALIILIVAGLGIFAMIGWRAPAPPQRSKEEQDLDDA